MKFTNVAGLVITPGASADREHSTLVAIDNALPELSVRRLTLATTSVNRAAAKIVEEVHDLADELGVPSEQIVIGGRSFGGRACSVAVAEGLTVGGLVLLSYPLHPPGKPDKLRAEHFGQITVPTLFISGRKDPFGSPDEFGEHLDSLGGESEIVWVDGAHAPKGAAEAEVIELVRNALL